MSEGLFQERLKAALPPLICTLERFSDAVRAGRELPLLFLPEEEIRTIAECLLQLGLTQDGSRLVEEWRPLQQWALGPAFDEALANIAASAPEKREWLRECCGDFPSVEELAEESEEVREDRRRGLIGRVHLLAEHLRQIQQAISAPAATSSTQVQAPTARPDEPLLDSTPLPETATHRPPSPPEGKDKLPAVDDDDIKILEELCKATPRLLNNYALESETRISRKTVGARLNRLIEAGLVYRPKGDRKGAAITRKGIDLLAKLKPPTTRR